MPSISALNAVNFFMADVRDGLGPFLGVFLQQNGWTPGAIGLVMTIGGLAGVAAAMPIGLVVDKIRAKRALMIFAALAVIVSSAVNYANPTFWTTATAQIIGGIAGATIGPVIAALTLGIVRQSGFAHQLGRNEAFNHAGNAFAAVLSGLLGLTYGFIAVFALMAVMAAASILATLLIREADIDHAAARGLEEEPGHHAEVSGFSVLLQSRPLQCIAVTMALFHFSNAAMLPLLGQAMVARGQEWDPALYTAATVLVAQLSMIPIALFAARFAQARGYLPLFLAALTALPIRGLIAWSLQSTWAFVPVQILDGVGAGLLGVALPGLAARILAGTGHVNAGLGAVTTLQGIGAALSTVGAGFVAQNWGYAAAFLALTAAALGALALWIFANRFVAFVR